jgi:DNA-binding NarL/FixJ family response regulator
VMDPELDPSAPIALLQARALGGLFDRDVEVVRAAAEEGVRLSRELSDLYALEMMSMNLGFSYLIEGDLRASRPRFTEALKIAHRIDDRVALYALLDALGLSAAASNQPRLAAQLLGAADAVRVGIGADYIGFLLPAIDQATESATNALGKARFDAEYQSGQRLTRDAAVALALGETAPSAAAKPAVEGPLGRRESDVARLVAEGLSNKQIGTRLFISERTVDSHVRSILNKLGFNSRAQIAAWLASSRQ